MKKNKKLFCVLIFCSVMFTVSCKNNGPGLTYPLFTDETEVIINGYNRDAMEPFIGKGGKFLFFNSLNDGDSTSLYYATKVNDIVFDFEGEVVGVNGTVPHLDAVASMDINNVFYFISMRDYPAVFENYQTGEFDNGVVTNVKPLMGDFYIYSPGWLIMDGEINREGDLLYYVNAQFTGGNLPDEARLGIAEKQDSMFAKLGSSDDILLNVNDTDYLVYAPCISSDGTELYFTRIRKGTFVTEICISVRSDTSVSFSIPEAIEVQGNLAEAPTLTDDGERLYYHKKLVRDNKYHIFTMRRE